MESPPETYIYHSECFIIATVISHPFHTVIAKNLDVDSSWIPAFAGMTGSKGSSLPRRRESRNSDAQDPLDSRFRGNDGKHHLK